jgi:thiamine biosynthesis lipoprotein
MIRETTAAEAQTWKRYSLASAGRELIGRSGGEPRVVAPPIGCIARTDAKAASRLLVRLLLCALIAGCGDRSGKTLELSGPTMGTYYSVKVARLPAGLSGEALQQGVTGVLAQAVAVISTYKASSELSRLNRNPSTDWIPVSRALLSVIAEGQRLSALSDGAFDITVGPLVNLWGFGPDVKIDEVPSRQAIAAAGVRVGYQKLQLRASPPAVRKQRGDMYIDLSALGEGYGADQVAAYLDARGIGDYMAAVAGAIRVKGRNADGTPWRIAIEEPAPEGRTVSRIMHITDAGLSTSGDYRNFFKKGGRRYSHEIDPKTGIPVDQRLASVTVVRPTAVEADGLATALMVMGDTKGTALAKREAIAAFFILREGKGFGWESTAAFRRYLAR